MANILNLQTETPETSGENKRSVVSWICYNSQASIAFCFRPGRRR